MLVNICNKYVKIFYQHVNCHKMNIAKLSIVIYYQALIDMSVIIESYFNSDITKV